MAVAEVRTQSEPARHRPPRVFLAAQRIKVKGALFNEIATPGDGARDGRLLLRMDQTNVPLAGSNESGSARAVPRLCRDRSSLFSPAATPIRRSIPRPSHPPRPSPDTTWTTILMIPSATHRTTPGAAAVVEWCAHASTLHASGWAGSPGVRHDWLRWPHGGGRSARRNSNGSQMAVPKYFGFERHLWMAFAGDLTLRLA